MNFRHHNPTCSRLSAAILLLVLCGCASVPATGQVVRNELPEVAQDVKVEQMLGADLPLHLEFEDDHNRFIQLGQLFRDSKPVLLSFNYSDCPRMCMIQLKNLAGALQHIDLIPGRDFHIVSVSLDPTEQSQKLAEAKRNYVLEYGDLESADGWHFLRGSKANITALTEVCGYTYKYIPESRTYSHQAAFIFCTSDGRISRYLDGLSGELDKVLKPALIEAGRGKIGSLADKVAYFTGCFVYDPSTGKYSLSAMRVMRLAGGATVVALAIFITPYWLIRRNSAGQPKTTPDTENKTQDHSVESPIQS